MTTSHDAVTVVIPTHNRRDLLLRTIGSVLRQSDVQVRVVVVDDGSADGTSEAVRRLGNGNVQLIRHDQARGVSAARNAGLAVADTKWVAFVDDDDLWAPDKLSAQIDALASVPSAAWSCAGAFHINQDAEILFYFGPAASGDVSSMLFRGNGIPGGGSGVLVSTDLAREVKGFDEGMSILADWDFYLRLSLLSPVAAVPRPLIGYFVHLDSMYHDPDGIITEFQDLEDKYADWPGVRLNIDYPAWYLRFVRMELLKGDRKAARALIGRACRRSRSGPGVTLFSWGLVQWAARKVVDRMRPVPPEAYSEESMEWLRRYRHDHSEPLIMRPR